MKKLIRSGLILAVIALAVGVGSRAFFSDTETSADNTFRTGAIDLKVDSVAHYNGMVCVDEKWSDCTIGEVNLLENGSFETPIVTQGAGWDIQPSGVQGWTVGWEPGQDTSFGGNDRPEVANLEFDKASAIPGATAQDGAQFTELDSDWFGPTNPLTGEPALVHIYQDIPTVAGTIYTLSYWFSPRPNTPESDNVMYVRINGSQVAMHSAAGGATTNWVNYSQTFVAIGATTRLEFAGGGTSNSLGVFLDDVSFTTSVCTPNPDYIAMVCNSSWTETDLGPTNQFFNFSDIKPGDFGENTISLHVIDNDAYACMYTSNMTETVAGPSEPRDEAYGDNPIDNAAAKQTYFFAWYDDGDNIWESGEAPITDEGPIAGEVFLNNGVFTLPNILGGETKYIGLAWCAGTMTAVDYEITCDGSGMDNKAQAKILTADISFYVEQVRNNPDFSCESVRPSPTPSLDRQSLLD